MKKYSRLSSAAVMIGALRVKLQVIHSSIQTMMTLHSILGKKNAGQPYQIVLSI